MMEKPPSMEVSKVKTRTLAEDAPRAWEGEQAFTKEELIEAVKVAVPGIGELQVIEQVVSHEGALLELYVREPGSDIGYQYVIKGAHKNALDRTVIIKIDYMGKDSEDVYYAEELLVYKDGAWEKA